MSSDIYDIYSRYWDYNGRPFVDDADIYALRDIVVLTNCYDEYKNKCYELFFNGYDDHKIKIAYVCYVAGMNRLVKHLKENSHA
jgi:hypothetical protein